MPRGPSKPAGDPLEDLAAKGPLPVYLVDGEERLLVDEAVKKIKEAALPKNARDFNFDRLSGKTAGVQRIIEAAQMLPAFAPRRLVLVDQADDLDVAEDAVGKDKKRAEVEKLIAYVKAPCPTTTLLLVGEKLDTRTKLYKAFQAAGATIRYNRPKEREMPELIRRRARSMGISVEEPAIRALVANVGSDATAAFQALEMLSLYAGARAITAADVEASIAQTREESIFALADAIGEQDRAAALRGLHAMISVSREHPLKILAMIARHWRNLSRARSLLDAGVPRQDILGAVGIPPFLLDNLLGQARRQTVSAFVRGLEAISETDRQLKGGPLDDMRAMERLVLNLMSGSC